jgi:hypothetical protein
MRRLGHGQANRAGSSAASEERDAPPGKPVASGWQWEAVGASLRSDERNDLQGKPGAFPGFLRWQDLRYRG